MADLAFLLEVCATAVGRCSQPPPRTLPKRGAISEEAVRQPLQRFTSSFPQEDAAGPGSAEASTPRGGLGSRMVPGASSDEAGEFAEAADSQSAGGEIPGLVEDRPPAGDEDEASGGEAVSAVEAASEQRSLCAAEGAMSAPEPQSVDSTGR